MFLTMMVKNNRYAIATLSVTGFTAFSFGDSDSDSNCDVSDYDDSDFGDFNSDFSDSDSDISDYDGMMLSVTGLGTSEII